MKQCNYWHAQRVASFCLLWLMATTSVSVSAATRFVFSANYFDGSISTFQANAKTGMLRHVRHTPTLKSPSSLVLRADGKFLYVTSQVLDKIAIYRVNQLYGTLSEIKASPVDSGVRSNFRLVGLRFGRRESVLSVPQLYGHPQGVQHKTAARFP